MLIEYLLIKHTSEKIKSFWRSKLNKKKINIACDVYYIKKRQNWLIQDHFITFQVRLKLFS